ncbi:MAG: hypothetical protein HY535_02665 [Chloroflexi bacterium]|nr:hypothetical protein [Chloroflexota bacterium]
MWPCRTTPKSPPRAKARDPTGKSPSSHAKASHGASGPGGGRPGAGDVFAAAFLIAYAETREVRAAGRFAAVAASLSVEAPGVGGIPTCQRVEERLRRLLGSKRNPRERP